jgi:hypothetical protein
LITSSAERATSKDVKTLTPQHFLEVISNDQRLNFLRDATLKSCTGGGGGGSNSSSNLNAYSNNGTGSHYEYFFSKF